MFRLLAELDKSDLEEIYEYTYKLGWLTTEERKKGWLPDKAILEKMKLEGALNSALNHGLSEIEDTYEKWLHDHIILGREEFIDAAGGTITEVYEDLLGHEGKSVGEKAILFQEALTTVHRHALMADHLLGTVGSRGPNRIPSNADATTGQEILNEISSTEKTEKWDQDLTRILGYNPTDVDPDDRDTSYYDQELQKHFSNRVAGEGFVPPKTAQKAAKRGLDLRKEFKRGGTAVGVARARDISNGRALSLKTVKRMHSFFSRHGAQVDERDSGWENSNDPSAQWIAWLLWGGDTAETWAENIVEKQKNKEED